MESPAREDRDTAGVTKDHDVGAGLVRKQAQV